MTTSIPRPASLTLATAAFAGLGLFAGCGAGTAGIVAGSNGSSGGATPTLTAFQVESPKVSPARLHLEASEALTAQLFFARQGSGEAPMTALDFPGASGNQVQLPAGASEVRWDFAAEPGLGGSAYVPDVDLLVRRPNGGMVSGGSLRLGVGNDPPVVERVEPMPTDPAHPEESSGNVEVRLGVSDSSSDVVTLTVEWRRASDAPDAWQVATAAGVFPQGIQTSAAGVALSYFWNTNVDLAEGDDDVLLRVTADDHTLDANGDPAGRSTPVVSARFHVDNNAAPVVQLLNDAVIASSDERRGISVPCRVVDEEGDPVQLILQWRREGEAFPALPEDGAALDALLADPAQRREKRVCTPYPRFAQGRVQPVDATRVDLPELRSSEAWLLAYGLTGQTLELLRPSSLPQPITPTWSANPLRGPIAALPVGDGSSTLVLDAPAGAWRLRRIELATGRVLPESGSVLASGPGQPSAMSLEFDEQGVLVASELSGTWRLERVELATGALTELAVSDGTQPGPVRGVANLGTRLAVFTVGNSLSLLDYRDPSAPRLATLLSGLAAPWGVVVDRHAPDRLYLSERDGNRVLAVELDTRGRVPVVVQAGEPAPHALERPEALALERGGSRLLVVTNTVAGAALVGLDLGAPGGSVAFPIGAARTTSIAGLASGADGLRILTGPDQDELLVAGGVEQRRTIQSYEAGEPGLPRPPRVVVDPPFAPSPARGQPWRIAFGPVLRASPGGVEVHFPWDSREAGGGQIFLQARARDRELGAGAAAAASKTVRSSFDVEPLLLDATLSSFVAAAALGDLDQDGDQDIVCADLGNQTVSVYFQESPGVFRAPLLLGGPGVTDFPSSIAIGDLDQDGDRDIVSSNSGAHTVTVFFQQSPGVFGSALVLGGPGVTDNPFAVALGDLDDDGDQDIAVSLFPGLAFFYQDPVGSFGAPQILSGSTWNGIAIDDLDGDGDEDLVGGTGHPFTGSALTFLFQGPLGFTVQEVPSTAIYGVAVGDLDGDGDRDVAGASSQGIQLFFQTSPGNYSTPLTVPAFIQGGGDHPIAIGDCDGDGDMDLVIVGGGLSVREHSIFLQESPGVFGPTRIVAQGKFASVSVALGDLDGDGDQDLVGSGDLGAQIYLQDSPGGLGVPDVLTPASAVFASHFDMAVGDLDGDGDQDLVGVGRLDNISIYTQGAPRSFDAPTIELGNPAILAPRDVEVADLDGDGDLDLVTANLGSDNLAVIRRGPSGFEAPELLGSQPLTEGASGVRVGDLDADGDLDIVSLQGGAFFLQDTSGAFTSAGVLGGGSDAVFVTDLEDFDADGDLDLFAGAGFAPSTALRIYLREPSGGYTAQDFPGIAGCTSIADLDGDGDRDILTIQGDNLLVYFRGPSSSFSAPLVLGNRAVTPLPIRTATGDLDGDGSQDIVTACFGNGTPDRLTVFFQRAPGRFGPGQELVSSGSANEIRHVLVNDLDGDGEQDILTQVFTTAVLWGGR